MKYDLRIKKLRYNAQMPTYGSEWAAGADMYAAIDEAVTIAPNETKFIPTGLAFEIPEGYAGFIYARSGLASKKGLAPANKVGVIDSDYQYAKNEGHIMVKLCGESAFTIKEGNAFCQGILLYYTVVDDDLSCEKRERVGGFGSTTNN